MMLRTVNPEVAGSSPVEPAKKSSISVTVLCGCHRNAAQIVTQTCFRPRVVPLHVITSAPLPTTPRPAVVAVCPDDSPLSGPRPGRPSLGISWRAGGPRKFSRCRKPVAGRFAERLIGRSGKPAKLPSGRAGSRAAERQSGLAIARPCPRSGARRASGRIVLRGRGDLLRCPGFRVGGETGRVARNHGQVPHRWSAPPLPLGFHRAGSERGKPSYRPA